MKFYEFKGEYEFYAMIGVHEGFKNPMELAIQEYAESIEGGMEEYNESYEEDKPTEITEKEALEAFQKANIEGCTTPEEKEKVFYKEIEESKKRIEEGSEEDSILFLIDGSLI